MIEIDFKKSLNLWTNEELNFQLRKLNGEISFAFMPPDISKNEIKRINEIFSDIAKIEAQKIKREKGEIKT